MIDSTHYLNEGIRAFNDYLDIFDNPYPRMSEEWVKWNEGYLYAVDEEYRNCDEDV